MKRGGEGASVVWQFNVWVVWVDEADHKITWIRVELE